MKFLILCDPDGTNSARLIKDYGIDPKQIWVWDYIETHQFLLHALSQHLGFNLIQDIEKVNMKFDKILSNPPYDNGMYVQFLKLLPNLLKEDGQFQFLVPNKILIPFTKGATYAKHNLRVDKIDLRHGEAFVGAIEGTWVCNVIGGIGKTDQFDLILPDGTELKTDFDSPNSVMEMSLTDFNLHRKIMRKDNKLIAHTDGPINSEFFVYIRPTPKRVNNKLCYHGVANEYGEDMKSGRYQICKTAEQAERMLKIYTESELFRYISFCNFGFTMINRFTWEFFPNIEDCAYDTEQDVYDFFNVTQEEIEHIQKILQKPRNKHH